MGTKRVLISFREDRVIVIRRRATCSEAWCQDCAGLVSFVTPGEAARAASVTTRIIYQWLETGKLHFLETVDGETMICLNSLPRREPV